MLVVSRQRRVHLFAITCFPPAVITNTNLHLLPLLLFQARFGTKPVMLCSRVA
ncbi:rCG48730 [Rattus norvegicus]|uniref:RCG48730 n=1 Tax=Rattus norvegicus TaxID=10116 RepID=A6IGH9_RAT|nr:rCG48730 [Rattus norvegicus]